MLSRQQRPFARQQPPNSPNSGSQKMKLENFSLPNIHKKSFKNSTQMDEHENEQITETGQIHLTLPNIKTINNNSQADLQNEGNVSVEIQLGDIGARQIDSLKFRDRYRKQTQAKIKSKEVSKDKNKNLDTQKSKQKYVFSKEVKQKLNLVLGEIKQMQSGKNSKNSNKKNSGNKTLSKTIQIEQVQGQVKTEKKQEEHYSDDSDFQAKINQNKQLIKMHRQKNQAVNSGEKKKKNVTSPQNKPTPKPSQKKISKPIVSQKSVQPISPRQAKYNRNDSLYQKRVKQQSLENKYLQKRKQIVNQRQKEKEKLINFIKQNYSGKIQQRDKEKEQYNSQKSNSKEINDKNRVQLKKSGSNKNSKSPVTHIQPIQNSMNQINKTINLFDSIHNFLQNKDLSGNINGGNNQAGNGGSFKKIQSKQIEGLSLLKAKRDIQDKIKLVNKKLLIRQIPSTSPSNPANLPHKFKSVDMTSTNRNWMKIQLEKHGFVSKNSDFDSEIKRIQRLQEKNSDDLNMLMQYKKHLWKIEQSRSSRAQ